MTSPPAKPCGAIPPGYRWKGGRLHSGETDLVALAERLGTPVFVYDGDQLAARVRHLRSALPPEMAVHYAMKANPYLPLVSLMGGLVDGLDIASAGELAIASEAGVTADRISFAGPGKTDAELKAALTAGATLHLESEGEAERALRLATELAVRPRLAVRVNPDFSIKGSGMRMGGGAAPFGIDAERVPALVRGVIAAGADWRGFHIFAGSQALDVEALIEVQRATVALAGRLAEEAGAPPPLVNLGGGFGIPYLAGETPLAVDRIGAALAETLRGRAASLAKTRFALELGRWLVGEAGVYLTRIVDRKISRGETFLVVDGGLHQQLAASGNFGMVVKRNYPQALASRAPDAGALETVTVVGCLCTPLDRLGDRVALPHGEPGDVYALFMAGAYGASASPGAFLGHAPAKEWLIGMQGEGRDVSKRS